MSKVQFGIIGGYLFPPLKHGFLGLVENVTETPIVKHPILKVVKRTKQTVPLTYFCEAAIQNNFGLKRVRISK